MSGASAEGWMPIGVSWRDGAPEIDWCLLRDERFTEPFFEDSVRRFVTRPFNKVFRRRTDAATLEAWAASRPGLMPNGFIFHMSRCGSTLVTRMLAARRDNIVLSESAAIDTMLRPPVPVPEEKHVAWLRALIGGMGQPRFGERHYVIKLDCWHVLFLPLIARAFPNVPRVFLYREPREVLASHLRQRGIQTVPQLLDPHLFGIDMTEAMTMPPPEYCARVLRRILEAATGEQSESLVNYRDLPEAVFGCVLPRFGMSLTAETRTAMVGASGSHSKKPGDRFSRADDAAPIPPNGPGDAAVAAHLDAPYQALERRRLRT